MNNLLFLVVLFCCFCGISESFAQKKILNRSSLQLSTGVSFCHQYQAPVIISSFIEGGFPLEQKPSFSLNANLSYFFKLSEHNSLQTGIGIGGYRYREKGMQGNGDATFSPYTGMAGWVYSDFSAGFRRVFTPEKKFSYFLEFNAMYELAVQDRSPINGGFALQQKVGSTIASSGNSRFIVAAFFKSGITRYNDLRYGNAYLPFAYGLQFGIIGRR